MRHGWDGGEGSGRAGREGYSLSIATVKVVTLEVSGDIICSRQLQSILVHTPAQAALSAPGWLALRKGMKRTTMRGGLLGRGLYLSLFLPSLLSSRMCTYIDTAALRQ